jgi:hypothetical protein
MGDTGILTVDPLRERCVGLAELARLVPSSRGGRPTNPTTVFRWITWGVA